MLEGQTVGVLRVSNWGTERVTYVITERVHLDCSSVHGNKTITYTHIRQHISSLHCVHKFTVFIDVTPYNLVPIYTTTGTHIQEAVIFIVTIMGTSNIKQFALM
jgi:hypothetical protein